jgi:glycosyltransferase involved in cell wall biosynthesis
MNRVAKGGPITFICHNVLPHERRALDPCLTRGVLRWGDQCIVQSDEEARLLRSLLPEARIKIQPHPLYDFFSHQRIPQPEARRKLNLPAAGLVFLFFGIVRRYKGLLELLEWWPAIRSEWGRAVLFIAGEFWDSRELYLARIKALGIEDSVVIDDRYIPNEELGIHFSAADVVLAPYLRKTGSGVAQMARGFGKPVVTGRGDTGSEQGILAEIRKALLHRLPNATGGEAVRDYPEEPAANWPDLVRLICGP